MVYLRGDGGSFFAKRSGLLRQGVTTLHDKPQDNRTCDWLWRYGWEEMDHAPHSPDLAPTELHLLGSLKKHLDWKWFGTDADLKQTVASWLQTLQNNLFYIRTQAVMPTLNKCLTVNCDYVEVWRIQSALCVRFIHRGQNTFLGIRVLPYLLKLFCVESFNTVLQLPFGTFFTLFRPIISEILIRNTI